MSDQTSETHTEEEALSSWEVAYFHNLARTFRVELREEDMWRMRARMILPSGSAPLKAISKWEYAWFIFIKMTHEDIVQLDEELGRKPTSERLASREQSEDEGDSTPGTPTAMPAVTSWGELMTEAAARLTRGQESDDGPEDSPEQRALQSAKPRNKTELALEIQDLNLNDDQEQDFDADAGMDALVAEEEEKLRLEIEKASQPTEM